MDRGVWQTIVHAVAESRTQLINIPFHFCFESMISLDIFSSQYELRSQKITTVHYTLMSYI